MLSNKTLEVASNLRNHGFHQVHDTPYFTDSHFTVQLGADRLILYVPFDDFVQRERIVGIRGIDGQGEPALTFITAHKAGEGFVRRSYRGGTTSADNNVEWTLQHLSSTSLEDQLKEAGFEPFPNTPSVYCLKQPSFSKAAEASELVALTEQGRLVSVLRAVPPSIQSKIDSSTSISARYETLASWGFKGETIPCIALTNDKEQFGVTIEGQIDWGSQKLFREMTEADLQISSFPPHQERSGFVIGGQNSTDTIRTIPSLNGIQIELLEAMMRPGALSVGGFLNSSESLLDVLSADNDYVLGRGTTHQELARHLKYAVAILQSGYGENFPYQGRTYSVSLASVMMGSQVSPFNDGTKSAVIYSVTNQDTGKEILFSALLPEMIDRYGFYEGHCPYRLDPKDIFEVFDFLR